MEEPSKKKIRREWSDEETSKLIDCWKENIEDLRKIKRNSAVYEAISIQLKGLNAIKTPTEVKLKIKNLTAKFRTEKKLVGSSGGSPSQWKFYSNIAGIIGNFPSNDDSLVDESILIEISDCIDVTTFDGIESTSASSTSLPSTGISSSSSSTASSSTAASLSAPNPRSSRPRKIGAIQEQLLFEISRGNDCMESYCQQATKYQEEHLKVLKESLNIQNSWYSFFTNKTNNSNNNNTVNSNNNETSNNQN